MIFEKIKERLNELCEQTYYNSVNGNRDEGIRNNAYHNAIDIINQVEAEYNNALSNMDYDFEHRINEVIPMLKMQQLLGTISLINDLKAENDILRSYLPQPPKGE